MPVIDPTRLQKQIQQCFANQSDARLFVTAIKDLLESYSDHTYRPGELAKLPSSLRSYHVPQPLLRALKREFASLSQSQPPQALTIARELWEQPYQECKDLAISILENLPLEMQNELFKISEQWVSTCIQIELIDSIARDALNSIRTKQPATLIEQAQKWIVDERLNVRKFGFLVLEHLSLSISFSDLPLLFKIISPYLIRCPAQIYPHIVSICNNLIAKSPKEMAYLMHTALIENPAADARKLIKSCLQSFPKDLQNDLNSSIKG
ncbi:MAG: hypothetical protein ANABAC_0408 [Anaerolineae bacterium]|jgi:hypothetical protein|nr:MAG: hypothetical protein ANABAC_0408 [Anaerolineae bacterium]